MKQRECMQWKEAKSGVNNERASLGHCSHIYLLELNINVWRSRAAKRSSRDTVGSFLLPQHLLFSCFMVPAKVFCFKRLIVVGSELEVKSFAVFHQMSLTR